MSKMFRVRNSNQDTFYCGSSPAEYVALTFM